MENILLAARHDRQVNECSIMVAHATVAQGRLVILVARRRKSAEIKKQENGKFEIPGARQNDASDSIKLEDSF